MKQKQVLEVIYNGNKVKVKRSRLITILRKLFRTNRKHKDRLFIKLFSDKASLLELYNAVNSSHYENPDELMITTLEDAVYMGMKNDCSFLIGNCLNLYEHQSTFNPNMPLRGFLYFASIIQGIIAVDTEGGNSRIYGPEVIKLPTPRYIVFYNGTEEIPDRCEMRLSDSFETSGGCMEFTALMLNINLGHNKKIMEQCRQLEEYSLFIDRIRYYKSNGYADEEAIDSASRDCIEKNILREFLLKNRSEVRKLILTDYDEKEHMDLIARQSLKKGKIEGKIESLLDLLNEFGTVPDDVIQAVKEQTDVEVLSRWIKAAGKANTLEDYQKQISSMPSDESLDQTHKK